ncbi:MAG: hypothetical protein OEY29_08210 [Gammaproteobacteria bacterium]|nr:hypothetical protein [Gammaproteobacteria bacterium]
MVNILLLQLNFSAIKKVLQDIILPVLYSCFWLTIHFSILGSSFPLYTIAMAVGYGLGHYLAQKKRGHCGLSADSIAIPVTIVIAIVSILIAKAMQFMPQEHELFINTSTAFVRSFILSFSGAHLFILLSAYFYSMIFERNS